MPLTLPTLLEMTMLRQLRGDGCPISKLIEEMGTDNRRPHDGGNLVDGSRVMHGNRDDQQEDAKEEANSAGDPTKARSLTASLAGIHYDSDVYPLNHHSEKENQ